MVGLGRARSKAARACQQPQELTVELPLGLSGAALRVFVDRITGPNTLLCEIWIYEADALRLVRKKVQPFA